MFSNIDYLSLGTVGFAQVGRPDYEQKVAVEKDVISSYFQNHELLKVPLEFVHLARFKWKNCPHDFGYYWDYQIAYNRTEIDEFEDDEDDENFQKYNRFWNWMNLCESAMGEAEEKLTDMMEQVYRKNITMEVVHKKFRFEDDEDKLKVV